MHPLFLLDWTARTFTIYVEGGVVVRGSVVECVLERTLAVKIAQVPRAPRDDGLEWLLAFAWVRTPYLQIAVTAPAISLESDLHALTRANEVLDPARDARTWVFRFEPLKLYRLGPVEV